MNEDANDVLRDLGLSELEICAVELVLVRMGVLPVCEHLRPKFIECYTLDQDDSINEQRWWKSMRELGFKDDVIERVRHALGMCLLDCKYCTGTVN